MARTKKSKYEVVKFIEDKVQKSKALVFVNVKGLKVQEIQELRKKCKEEKTEVYVAKKSLLKHVLDTHNIEGLNPKMYEGEVGVIFAYEDEISHAKVVTDFAKKHEALGIFGACMFSATRVATLMDAQGVRRLAAIPSKQELLASLVGSIASPLRGLVGVLNGPQRGFVQVLNQLAQQKA